MKRTTALPIALVLIAIMASCSTERPTRGHSGDTFPTLNLSDAIVLRTIGPFDSVVYFDSSNNEFGLQLPRDLIPSLGDNVDIELNYGGPELCDRANVFAFDFSASTWVEVENQRTGAPCYGMGGGTTLTLLPFPNRTPRSFVSSFGLMRLKGDLHQPSAKVLEVHPEYRPKLLSLSLVGVRIEWVGNGALLLTRQLGDADWLVDSVIHFDRSGNRTFAGDLGGAGGFGMSVAWSGTGLWAAFGTESGTRYSLLDEQWHPVVGFDHRWSDSVFPGDFAWVGEELWLAGVKYSGSRFDPVRTPFVTVLDPMRSLDSGFSVETRTIILDKALIWMGDLVFDGDHVCAATGAGIIRLDRDGQIVDTLPMPVLPSYSTTWDGEAFWIVHSYGTDHHLLSRFYPR